MWADETTNENDELSSPSEENGAQADESLFEESSAQTNESPAPPDEPAEQLPGKRVSAAVWIAGGAGLLLIILGIASWLRPAPETLDGFIARWNSAVQQETAEDVEEQFGKLLLESTFSEGSSTWAGGKELLQTLRERGNVLLEPSDTAGFELNPKQMAVPAVQTPNPDNNNAAQLKFQLDADGLEYTLDMDRGGWTRQWRIANLVEQQPSAEEQTAAMPEEPIVSQAFPLEEPTEPTIPEGAPIDTELKLRQILEAWRSAWERKDVENYIKWYADFAEIMRVTVVEGSNIEEPLTVHQLRDRMSRLAKKYGDIQVKIDNLRIEGDRAEADLKFNQTYKAYNGAGGDSEVVYSDKGIKTLKFVVNEKGEWRIYFENWTTYIDVPSYPLD